MMMIRKTTNKGELMVADNISEHYLNERRKQAGLTIWRMKRLLESEHDIIASEGKLSR